MFLSEEFLPRTVFAAVIGGIIAVVFLKLLENKRAALRETGAGNKSGKRPQEHDERFC